MLGRFIGFFGTLGIGIAIGMRICKNESEAEVSEAFEKGMQTGFKTAPEIYRRMVKNGDIEQVPEGMNIGEVGKVFTTLEEAKLARLRRSMESGFKGMEKIFILNGKTDFGTVYMVANLEDLRRG